MEFTSGGGCTAMVDVILTRNQPVCHFFQSETLHVCEAISRSESLCGGCHVSVLGFVAGVCVSTICDSESSVGETGTIEQCSMFLIALWW